MARLSRRARTVAVAVMVVVAVAAFAGLTLRLFVFPDLNAPLRSDAIVVLGGNGDGPKAAGVRLAREGYAPTIAFSINGADPCPPVPGPLPRVHVMCFRPSPSTTQGEARGIGRLAAEKGWHRIIVVMPVTQATRARLRVGWCYPGRLLVVASTPPGLASWVRDIAYEWGALVKTLLLTDGC